MAFSSCFCYFQISLKNDYSGLILRSQRLAGDRQKFSSSLQSNSTKLFGQRVASMGANVHNDWSFLGGSRIIFPPKLTRFTVSQRRSGVHSWLTNSQVASSVFTLGTAAVLPFYTLMVIAPRAELTRKSMESSIPYLVLGLLYALLLYLSWTPDTIRLMFASKYWLPEFLLCLATPCSCQA